MQNVKRVEALTKQFVMIILEWNTNHLHSGGYRRQKTLILKKFVGAGKNNARGNFSLSLRGPGAIGE